MAIVAGDCQQTCSRPSATTSVPTLTSATTNRAASSSTPTGPAEAVRPHPLPTTCDSSHSRPDALNRLGLGNSSPRVGKPILQPQDRPFDQEPRRDRQGECQ